MRPQTTPGPCLQGIAKLPDNDYSRLQSIWARGEELVLRTSCKPLDTCLAAEPAARSATRGGCVVATRGIAASGWRSVCTVVVLLVSGNWSETGSMFRLNRTATEFTRYPNSRDLNASGHYDSPALGSFKVFGLSLREHVGIEIEREAFRGFLSPPTRTTWHTFAGTRPPPAAGALARHSGWQSTVATPSPACSTSSRATAGTPGAPTSHASRPPAPCASGLTGAAPVPRSRGARPIPASTSAACGGCRSSTSPSTTGTRARMPSSKAVRACSCRTSACGSTGSIGPAPPRSTHA